MKVVMGKLRYSIKCVLNAFGIEVHRFRPELSPLARLMAAIRAFDIDLVIDIGANEGQFAKELRAGGYKKRIVSFEPLEVAHERLLLESRNDPNWTVHSRCALGDHEGEIELNIAGNSVSSSILPMLELHNRAAPGSMYLGKELVPLTTVDEVVLPYLGDVRAPLLKIDTQGYEWHVLDGARATLPHVRGVIMELSMAPLYQGQHLWRECVERLEAEGYQLWALEPIFMDPKNGRTLQMDGIFFRL